MPVASVNGIDVYFELHGEGPPLLNISGSGNDLRRSPAALDPGQPIVRDPALRPARARPVAETRRRLHDGRLRRRRGGTDPLDGMGALSRARHQFRWNGRPQPGDPPPRPRRSLVLCCTSPGGEAPLPVARACIDGPRRGVRHEDEVDRSALGPRRRRPDTRARQHVRPDRRPTGTRGPGIGRSRPPDDGSAGSRRRRRTRLDRCPDAGVRRSPRRHRADRELGADRRIRPGCRAAGVRRRSLLHGSRPIGFPGHHRVPRGRSRDPAPTGGDDRARPRPRGRRTLRHVRSAGVLPRSRAWPNSASATRSMLVGDQFIEVLSPTREGTTVQRLLDKRGGAGGYMAIFEVDDLDDRVERLAATRRPGGVGRRPAGHPRPSPAPPRRRGNTRVDRPARADGCVALGWARLAGTFRRIARRCSGDGHRLRRGGGRGSGCDGGPVDAAGPRPRRPVRPRRAARRWPRRGRTRCGRSRPSGRATEIGGVTFTLV